MARAFTREVIEAMSAGPARPAVCARSGPAGSFPTGPWCSVRVRVT